MYEDKSYLKSQYFEKDEKITQSAMLSKKIFQKSPKVNGELRITKNMKLNILELNKKNTENYFVNIFSSN